VVLGLSVLLIAALLSGSARNQAFQARPAALTRTATAGGSRVELTPSGLQPGLIDYQVRVTGGLPPRRVTLAFAARGLGVAAHRVTATALGDDTLVDAVDAHPVQSRPGQHQPADRVAAVTEKRRIAVGQNARRASAGTGPNSAMASSPTRSPPRFRKPTDADVRDRAETERRPGRREVESAVDAGELGDCRR
jgi:hypothetical protein